MACASGGIHAERQQSDAAMQVLISAYSCSPGAGSEPGNGWNWTVQAARFQAVLLLTSWDPSTWVLPASDEGGSLEVVHIRIRWWPSSWLATDRFVRVHYLLWQALALITAWRLDRRRHFQVIHHVTFNAIDFPGLLWLLAPAFIWGPVGGGQLPHPALRRYFGAGWQRERLRALRKRLVVLNPLARGAARRASVVMAANQETAELLGRLGASCVISATDVGVASGLVRRQAATRQTRELRLLWAGVLTPRKGPLLALDVVAELRHRGVPVRLRLAGDGRSRAAVEARIRELGAEPAVTLLGRLSPTEMDGFYEQGDLFLFTSLHDTSGTVVLEAMAHGLPVVCLDQHGVREMVDQESGCRVGIGDADQVVADLASALAQLWENPELRETKGEAAARRVADQFAWERRGELLRTVYTAATARKEQPGEERASVTGAGASIGRYADRFAGRKRG